MIRLAKTSSLLAVPLLALAIAGCGGGGGDSTSTAATTETTAALSKAELISQGDAICAEVNAAVGGVGSSGEEVPEQITQVANLYIGMAENLKDLGAPTEAAGYAEFIEAAEELSATQGATKLATEREDTAAIGEAAEKSAPALEEFQSAAGEYGFEKCSEGPSTPTAGVTGSGTTEEVEEGGVEAAPEVEEEVAPEEVAPEVAPETGGAGGGVEEAAPEAAPETGGSSGGVGPG